MIEKDNIHKFVSTIGIIALKINSIKPIPVVYVIFSGFVIKLLRYTLSGILFPQLQWFFLLCLIIIFHLFLCLSFGVF